MLPYTFTAPDFQHPTGRERDREEDLYHANPSRFLPRILISGWIIVNAEWPSPTLFLQNCACLFIGQRVRLASFRGNFKWMKIENHWNWKSRPWFVSKERRTDWLGWVLKIVKRGWKIVSSCRKKEFCF